MKWVEDIPFGLVLCRADGEDLTITALSETGLRVRRIGEEPIRCLSVSFLKTDLSGYTVYKAVKWLQKADKREKFAVRTEIEIEDALFSAEIRRVLHDYARYIRLKEEGDDEYMSALLTGCPYEDATEATLDGQKKRWFSSLSGYSLPGNWELALMIDRPELYELFLKENADDFRRMFLYRNHLTGHALFAGKVQRIYLGNEFCLRLCPDAETVRAMSAKVRKQGLKLTAVLPPLREEHAARGQELVDAFSGWADEMEVNDIGSLAMVGRTGAQILLGIHLNRRRKDPRMEWKRGDKTILTENCVNSAEYMDWMRARGVVRVEYEACGYPIKLGSGAASIHFPFFQTNTSHDCPLAAACMGLDVGQRVDRCGRVCLDYARVYPEKMKLVGRYNSLFGLDLAAMTVPDRLADALAQGADRLVVNLL